MRGLNEASIRASQDLAGGKEVPAVRGVCLRGEIRSQKCVSFTSLTRDNEEEIAKALF